MTERSSRHWLTVCWIQQGGVIDDSSSSGYHCHGSPYINNVQPRPVTGLDQWQPAAEQTFPSSGGMAEGERRMLNVPLHLVIDTKPLVYRRHGDLHLFTVAPPSLLLPHLCYSPLHTPLHSHNLPCLCQHCMKWILPHPAAMILISLLPLLSSFLSPLFIAHCIDSTSPSEPAS